MSQMDGNITMGVRLADIVNGREHDPIGHYVSPWYTVEIRGPLFQGKSIEVWMPFDNVADAVADAERRGPIKIGPEISN